MDVMILGIAGGTGSGKTTLTRRLKERFGDEVSVVYHDNYYKRRDDLTYEERCAINYDHPNAFDTDMLLEHLAQLKAGKAVECPVYDFTVHNRSDKTVLVQPAPVTSSPSEPVTLAARTGNSAWERMACMVGMPQLNSWLPRVMAS